MSFARCIVICIVAILGFEQQAHACDQLIGTIVRNKLTQPIKDIDCPHSQDVTIGVCPVCKKIAIGIDKKHHALRDVCYTAGSVTSTFKLTASLECRDSDESVASKAGIDVKLSENIELEVEIRNSDCELVRHNEKASGVVGQAIIDAASFFNLIQPKLREAVAQVCR